MAQCSTPPESLPDQFHYTVHHCAGPLLFPLKDPQRREQSFVQGTFKHIYNILPALKLYSLYLLLYLLSLKTILQFTNGIIGSLSHAYHPLLVLGT